MARYTVGIDLGTTHTVVAAIDAKGRRKYKARIVPFEIPQIVDSGEVGKRLLLPSFLYLPSPHEFPAGALALPWDAERTWVAGEFARKRGSEVPARLVTSAKSWLCHGRVDRTAAILPWGAPEEVGRISPVEASARYLRHVKEAWAAETGTPLEEQDLVLTVPASFDEAARELTALAAKAAGLEKITVLEEPQAAFYSWLDRHRDDWTDLVRPGQLVLVCDVGGGTSDFTLIEVVDDGGKPGFRRVAVGDHLLLGGDNMDLALAARLEPELVGPGGKLDAAQWSSLRLACRLAKEALLGEAGLERTTVAIPGRGSKLVGGTLKVEVDRRSVEEWLLEGFLPRTAAGDRPQRGARTGLGELSLPYASDPAITRHLAAFLADAGRAAGTGPRRPDLLLYNGGVFKAECLRRRLLDVLGAWFPEAGPPAALEMPPEDLDLAVARGASYYGLVRRGEGVKIAGGTPRSFYVGLAGQPVALCVAPQGLEEGEEVDVEGREFELLIRQPVVFPLYTSSHHPEHAAGDLAPIDPETMASLPPIRTVLKSGRKQQAEKVRVRLRAALTEVGTLELWCVAADSDRRWRLNLDVRSEPEPIAPPAPEAAPETGPPRRRDEPPAIPDEAVASAEALIRSTFAKGRTAPDPKLAPVRLMKNLEETLGHKRGAWAPAVLRRLWPALLDVAERRKADGDAESRWFNLAGYLLRPGFGFPADDFRVKQVWKLFEEGIAHPKGVQSAVEFWILWRRVAGGLVRGQQEDLFRRISTRLFAADDAGKKRVRKFAQEDAELWRAAASLERIDPRDKIRLGDALASRLGSRDEISVELWALGRVGARTPLYGPIDAAVPPDSAARWIRAIFDAGLEGREAHFALAHLARMTGDRPRDIDPMTRRLVVQALESGGAAARQVKMASEVVELDAEDQAQMFGDSLPPALHLVD